MFTEEEIGKLLEAGKIVRSTREMAPRLVFEGARLIDICEGVEAEIRGRGGKPAFPCNVSIDEVGAHYTSPPGDARVVPAGSLVKVDIGAHVDGFLADSAVTVSVGSDNADMIRVAESALEKAIQAVKIGGKISDVGGVVEKTIKSQGYKPIRNLTGHQISEYTIHAGVSVPNVTDVDAPGKFQPWSIYALEPFVTLPDADGHIEEGPLGNILHLAKLKKPKDEEERKYFQEIYAGFRTLPFARRWVSGFKGYDLTGRMIGNRALYEYPTLVEASGMPIAQAEHTLLMTDKDIIIVT